MIHAILFFGNAPKIAPSGTKQRPSASSVHDLGPRVQEGAPHADGKTRAVKKPERVVRTHAAHSHDGRQEVLEAAHHRRRQRRVGSRTHENRVL